jgi:hypothetical protein
MRFRAYSLAAFAASSLSFACSDPAPTFPPIVINVFQGNGGSGFGGQSSGTGNRPSGNAGTSGSSSNAGTGNNGPGGLFAHCDEFSSAEDPPVQTACDLTALEDGGSIEGDIKSDRTLESGKFYTLKGSVRVFPGKKLTIEPCVEVRGEDPEAVLLIMASELGDPQRSCKYADGDITPAGQLIAVGEPMAPIVFTSAKPRGQRASGDWGGLLLLGNARNDLAILREGARYGVPIEGLVSSECHGHYTDEFNDESSGSLEYVRVEYASRKVSENSETNALTFGSVGSGTKVSHVMVKSSADDCFEWFGGSANADHLIALNCEDDGFDADNGFSGKLQFLFSRQWPNTNEVDSRGMEIDTGNGPKAVKTTVAVSNFTVCGGGPTDSMSSRQGLVFRTESTPSLMNGMITGFAGEGIALYQPTSPTLTHSRIFGQKVLAADQGTVNFFTQGEGNSLEDPDRFCDCWAEAPIPVAATSLPGGAPTGFADEAANYVGAFKDATPSSNWMKGAWVDWSSN